jgi:hypothetical protein
VHEALRAALAPVLADIAATTDLDVRVEEADWGSVPEQATAMIWVAGSGTGVSVILSESVVEQQVSVADQALDWVPEELGGTATNWPVCPEHPATHPLAPRVVDGAPTWVCPVSGTPVATIGALAAER